MRVSQENGFHNNMFLKLHARKLFFVEYSMANNIFVYETIYLLLISKENQMYSFLITLSVIFISYKRYLIVEKI